MISILYLDSRELPPPDKTLDDDLRLSEIVTGFCPNTERQRVFLSVLTNLSTDRRELELRRGILADFISNPQLATGLRRELDELTRLSEEANRDRARSASMARGTYSEASAENQKHALIFLAVNVEKSLEVVVRIAELLRRAHPTSPRLCELLAHAENYTAHSHELCDICGRITSLLSNGGNMLLRLNFDRGGRINGCELASGRVATPPEEPKPTLSIMKLFSKLPKNGNADSSAVSVAKPEHRVSLPDPGNRLRNRFSFEAFVTLSNILSGYVRELIDGFKRLSDELVFYELALDYINLAKEKELPLCYPEIIEPDSDSPERIEITRLYDLLLATRALAAKDIVPNDVSFPRRGNSGVNSNVGDDDDHTSSDCVDNSTVPGILITGENNSGKTVYLRSVGMAQLLFQAGLPVPCESAKMRISSAVYTCYAAAEKEFVSGNDAGRFEQEVRDFSRLAEKIQPNSLLLLNEVFQTTAYSEGAEGLYHILNYFTRHGVVFIAVTHLKELVPLYGDRIRHLVTAPGYRVEVATETPS